MTGTFRLSPEFSIRIEGFSQAGGVLMILYRGVCYDHHLGDPGCKEVGIQEIILAKGPARAIASTIMACAAESAGSRIQAYPDVLIPIPKGEEPVSAFPLSANLGGK